jgi:hypothetical protein
MFLALGCGIAAGLAALGGLSATAQGIALGTDLKEFNDCVLYAVPKKQRKYLPKGQRKMDGILLTYKEIELLREFGDPHGHTPVWDGYPDEDPHTVFKRGAERIIKFAPLIAMMGQRDAAE